MNQIAPGNHRPKELNYEFDYVYESPRPHAPSRIGEWLYFYDENGNTVRKERRKDEWPHHHFPGCGRCDEYSWDEENRLIKAEVGGKSTYFLYDAAGERRLKRGPHGETVYVSEYFQLRNRQQATKHVFVGTTRIVSKLAHFHPLYNPYDAWYERWNIYTYHPDHLGSSNFITDPEGREFEHIEYTPYGETWIDEGTNKNIIGYRFTSKELDEETGLYYFGAR